MDRSDTHWTRSILEVVLDAQRVPHHNLRRKCRSLGWYAVPASVWCCTSYVLTEQCCQQL